MKKFASAGLAVAVTASVLMVGCSESPQGNGDAMTQARLANYCGIDLDKLRADMKAQDSRIEDVQILDTDCKTRVVYREADGDREYVDMDNDDLLPLLAMGALAGYVLGDSRDRDHYRKEIRRKDRSSFAYTGPYVSKNSRAAASYRTGSRASGINVSSKTGAVTTRSNTFSGTSSVARSSSYSGG